MDWLIFAGIIVVAIPLGVLAQRKGWIDLANTSGRDRTGGGGGLVGIGDEVFSPARYETQLELDRQTMLPAPAPVAGDGDKGIYEGRMRIDLTGDAGDAAHTDPEADVDDAHEHVLRELEETGGGPRGRHRA